MKDLLIAAALSAGAGSLSAPSATEEPTPVPQQAEKDLAPGVQSGLDVATKVLGKIDDIAFCKLTSADVVRHPLVQKIVKAYDDFEAKENSRKREKNGKKAL